MFRNRADAPPTGSARPEAAGIAASISRARRREPSIVELAVGEKVQLDRLLPSDHGHVAERHGRLLDRGVATLSLEPGYYFFKTLSDTHLKVIRGGVAHRVANVDRKDDPPEHLQATPPDSPPPTKGDEPPGDAPLLTVE